jgi:hypothetical protein
MSRRALLVIPSGHAEYVQGGNAGGSRIGKTPNGTYVHALAGVINHHVVKNSHPVSSLRELIYDPFLIGCSPFFHLRIRVNNRLDIIKDVLLLPLFVMKANRTALQTVEDVFDINVRATS